MRTTYYYDSHLLRLEETENTYIFWLSKFFDSFYIPKGKYSEEELMEHFAKVLSEKLDNRLKRGI